METLPAVKEIEMSIDDIKRYIAPTATDKELFMFLNIAKSYGLNPAKREVHFVKYGNNPGQTIVGYESYLKRAEATGKLDGWDCHIEINPTTKKRIAKITIHRKDRSKPFTWEVDEDEFNRQQSTWKAMPNFMLKKVCIAQGFRLCFPDEVGGMPYIPEELPQTAQTTSESLPKHDVQSMDVETTHIQQSDSAKTPNSHDLPPTNATVLPETKPAPAKSDLATPKQRGMIFAKGKEAGWDELRVKSFVDWFRTSYHADEEKLSKKSASELIDHWDDLVANFKAIDEITV